MVIGNADADTATGGAKNMAHPSGIPQDKIDNIMSGIANTGDVKMNNHRKKLRQRFDIIKKLGQGTYGKVQLGINKETGQEVAIKTIKKCKIEAEADLVRIRREVQIMSSVQHPNIIHIYEVFENREKMVLVMEFAAGGELYDYLSERKVLSEEEARRIFRQVATAVYYCHKHKICHRDLKLENILLDEHGNAKIADFGLSNVFDDQRLLATFCGSPLYASPEIVEGTPYQGPEVDCWSLGVLLYTLVYGSMPFDGSNFKRLVKQISQGDYYEPKKPSRASSLIRDMLTVCPRKRATIEQICSHWWVNENDNVSCLDLAEDLANQTPVRLDVLLSLTPTAITADQLVVPSADGGPAGKGGERVPRSHSVGSIRDMGANTEAERRILDMVAAGGEAALMPSPTRTITPAQSPVQTKRKLENTVSTENAAGAVKKKEKAGSSSLVVDERTAPLDEETPMETEDAIVEEPPPTPAVTAAPSTTTFSQHDMEAVGDMCAQLMQNNASSVAMPTTGDQAPVPRQKTVGKLDSVEEAPEEKDATKVIKKFVNKHKTADLVNAIGQVAAEKTPAGGEPPVPASDSKAPTSSTAETPKFVRKCSLQDESPLTKFNERRKSRILETAEKFQQMNAGNGGEKAKKLVIPGVSVGSFKKEFERKASVTAPQGPTAGERRALEQVAAAAAAEESGVTQIPPSAGAAAASPAPVSAPLSQSNSIEGSDSKNSMTNFSLDEARRSMENSIALLRQAQNESSKEVDQLCAKTETFGVHDEDPERERERRLKNARAIIGNAIQPAIRRPLAPPPTPLFGIGGGGGQAGARAAGGGFSGFGGFGGGCGASAASTPSPPVTGSGGNGFLPPQTAPVWPPTANGALAAARQMTMGRSAPGASTDVPHHHHQHHHNHIHSHSSSSSLQHQKPQQYLQLQAQQLQQRPQYQPYQPKQFQQPKLHHLNNHHQQHQQQLQQASQIQNQHNHISLIPPPSLAPAPAPAPTSLPPPAAAAIAIATAKTLNSSPKPFYNTSASSSASSTSLLKPSPGGDPNAGTVKTSSAQITLKSATLPRRKTAKTEIQLDIKPRIVEQSPMRFTTEMQHPVADLRSAPAREGPNPYSPITTAINARATSLEPKEHIIPIQRPQMAYTRTGSNTTTRSGSLSRQSTIDSESDTTTTNLSQSTITGSSQPIKKSPREFIIPIAVEGGGFITPREGSIEPSESSQTTSSRSTFSRLRPTRRIGSLLNDSGVDESLPFPMRTASINRDGDDDSRFTLHRLRSSRPVKKISQDNDSQSSGEEDDDDGFEILTAENLFSTLLQRVRALTNRLNVNNDIPTGFPNSSRLLNNLRQGQSSFWNQQPFGRSQVSYTYSETVEKKQVRLNNAGGGNGVGAPWRHSMSRDLGSDMDSMFSRTGATLPRGPKTAKTQRKATDGPTTPRKTGTTGDATDAARGNDQELAIDDEPLDLADLDLSRLRLSKKDLETLSSITPGLPKCFQEQLLAKLPPTQARKLSRTLSMQNNPQPASVKVYKRSQSGGRGLPQEVPPNDLKENIAAVAEWQRENPVAVKTTTQTTAAAVSKVSDETTDRSSNLMYRRSMSRTRYDYDSVPSTTESSTKSRSNSVCRDDYGKSLCSSYSSDISDKYRYYSPYLSKSAKDTSTDSGSLSPLKRYGSVSPRESCHSPQGATAATGSCSGAAALGRPPSGCLSPPPIAADGGSSSLRRRSSQRRISRFLRPDFFEEPAEDNPYQREKKLRERETQSVLREIREKSRESSRDRLSSYDCDELYRRKQLLPAEEAEALSQRPSGRHVRNKSLEVFGDRDRETSSSSSQDALKRHRRSLSRPRELCGDMDKSEIADKILQELQILSAVKSQHEQQRLSVPRELSAEKTGLPESSPAEEVRQAEDSKEKTATIKKVKKLKPKEKVADGATEAEGAGKAPTTLVKKVKKIVKKTESSKTVATPATPTDEATKSPAVEGDKTKPESRLKRPKSYPTKDPNVSAKADSSAAPTLGSKLPLKSSAISENTSESAANLTLTKSAVGSGLGVEHRENRLVRPKSYPASKLAPPKDAKKTTRSGIAIPCTAEPVLSSAPKSCTVSRQSTSEEKSTTVTPSGRSSIDTSSSSESRPTAIKKIIKVTKKSKLVQPTAVTPIATATGTGTAGEEATPVEPSKEKSPEKKVSKGLLYAIGQKFEKLRDSAMSKDKKSSSSSNSSTTNGSVKRSSPEKASPEKFKEKTKVLKKKKSTDVDNAKTEKNITTPADADAAAKSPKTPSAASNDAEKPAKSEKRSRIDAMIRSLRDRSVPRSQPITESNYIKRAVSVEEMPGTFNRNAVNRVLGLFRRFEKDGSERKVRNTRSTSNIERQMHGSPPSPIYQNAKERPRSSGFLADHNCNGSGNGNANVNAASKPKPAAKKVMGGQSEPDADSTCDCKDAVPSASASKFSCPDCIQDQATALTNPKPPEAVGQMQEPAQSNKDKRKALMLDLVKLEKLDNNASVCSRSKAYLNGNGLYSNLPPYPGAAANSAQSNDNAANNNNSCTATNNNNGQAPAPHTSHYRTSSTHEINRNHMFTPSSENIANYSSDSRSYQDDCASTSTFLSPTDEPELYFDNWSVCSEDNYMLATPSPTVSRLSRASQLSSPTRGGDGSDPNESVIDRIKRRSFYCRFNEKKPKRTSSIVGPSAVRDYYREQQAAVKARSGLKPPPPNPSERAPSPDITQEFFRPLKLSPVGTELKPPIYKAPLDHSSIMTKPRKSLNDIRPTTSPSFLTKRYGSSSMNSANDNDYLSYASAVPTRIKTSGGSSSYESNGGYYNTYSPKRRSSYTLNGVLPSGASNVSSSHIDGYATVGRRSIRPYDQRTMSLLEPPSASSTSFSRRDTRTPVRDYTSSISRSNSHYRSPAVSRSPTNI